MESCQVLILLAAYKGSAYIRPMVDSILAQDCDQWQLILSDDGTDTADILQTYADRYPDKIRHYRSGLRFGSAQKHFMHLLRRFGDQAPYIMFCDQDDVWHLDKVSKTLAKMRQTEEDPQVPVMVHTDLNVVDGALQQIHPSFLEYSGLDGNAMQLHRLLVQNVVTGCTMMINRALAQLADRDFDEKAVRMHDWYLALLASACGKCAFLPETTIEYRQHGSNTVGAQNGRSVGFLLRRARSDIYGTMAAMGLQAGELARCYGDVLSGEQVKMLTEFADSFQKGKCSRLRTYQKYGLWKAGFAKKVGQILFG